MKGLILEVGERLVLIEEVIDDDFGESGKWHIFTETLVDYCQSSPWLMHVIHKHVGVLVQWTFVSKLNKKSNVPELLHKDFWDICIYGESLEALGVLDKINDYFKCLFLLWHCGFQSNIGKADLNSLSEWNPFFITSSNLVVFLEDS
ncbi:hypothetical protein Tco_0542154 [Tanacetum coccineum]